MDGAPEIVEPLTLAGALALAFERNPDIRRQYAKLGIAHGDLQDAAIEMRTLPFSSVIGPFARAVRDLAAASGRDVELIVEGEKTELDRVILEGIAGRAKAGNAAAENAAQVGDLSVAYARRAAELIETQG